MFEITYEGSQKEMWVCILRAFQHLEVRDWADEEGTARETGEQPVGQEGYLESVEP